MTTTARLFKNGRSQAPGQARRHGATLVTSNTKEFARVSSLKREDWAAARR